MLWNIQKSICFITMIITSPNGRPLRVFYREFQIRPCAVWVQRLPAASFYIIYPPRGCLVNAVFTGARSAFQHLETPTSTASPSYLQVVKYAATSSMVGAAATSDEQAKRRKYENLDSSFIFLPFEVETLGPWGPEARALFKELSKRVIESSGDPRAGSYLGQGISLAIQRGNAASILGTVPRCGGFEDVLDFI
ncbi:jg19945 [Pararge aegeria aegeria]|uniref:Jg19945 protein n=1 Tax=Pararge aegeria aegeria TaxID=348720 RepID=A0A8S4RX48_9NEOP|nr:jg19945 [Pararge aegeria aegeria]